MSIPVSGSPQCWCQFSVLNGGDSGFYYLSPKSDGSFIRQLAWVGIQCKSHLWGGSSNLSLDVQSLAELPWVWLAHLWSRVWAEMWADRTWGFPSLWLFPSETPIFPSRGFSCPGSVLVLWFSTTILYLPLCQLLSYKQQKQGAFSAQSSSECELPTKLSASLHSPVSSSSCFSYYVQVLQLLFVEGSFPSILAIIRSP